MCSCVGDEDKYLWLLLHNYLLWQPKVRSRSKNAGRETSAQETRDSRILPEPASLINKVYYVTCNNHLLSTLYGHHSVVDWFGHIVYREQYFF